MVLVQLKTEGLTRAAECSLVTVLPQVPPPHFGGCLLSCYKAKGAGARS